MAATGGVGGGEQLLRRCGSSDEICDAGAHTSAAVVAPLGSVAQAHLMDSLGALRLLLRNP